MVFEPNRCPSEGIRAARLLVVMMAYTRNSVVGLDLHMMGSMDRGCTLVREPVVVEEVAAAVVVVVGKKKKKRHVTALSRGRVKFDWSHRQQSVLGPFCADSNR